MVLNRADSSVGITLDDVETIVGREPDILVPSDRGITRSINIGAPIVTAEPRSEAAKAFRSLASTYEEQFASAGDAQERVNGRRRIRLRRRSA
jgi:pilus assembly protein CpaE